ncbi:PREDICTED: signal recognition particle 14 kDa protein isoform X3 [Nelumbo nucifera]|uniref:Signal recognition particle 14 kDa protein n=1 Tax=Nelumbo nucifera TaxID=4432 RepID=A0A1U8AYP5_NELNU|nr:PREDICTED: signal recognition particle 14 kDa protein isoform X3 [Nelumbo nucifera]
MVGSLAQPTHLPPYFKLRKVSSKSAREREREPSLFAFAMVLLQPDPFLNELTSMYERTTERGSVWVTLKRSSMKSKAKRNKMTSAGETIEYRCLVRATDGKKTISTVAPSGPWLGCISNFYYYQQRTISAFKLHMLQF